MERFSSVSRLVAAVVLGAAGVAHAQYEVAKLVADDGQPVGWFGQSLAITGDTLVVGAHHWLSGDGLGVAYVFDRAGIDWVQSFTLVADDGRISDDFGCDVAASGDVVLVGAWQPNISSKGAAYVFERVRGGWTQIAKLTAPDGELGDRFGVRVSIDGRIAVIGAYYDDDLGEDSGSAYVFEEIDGEWVQVAKLLPTDGAAGDWFGLDVLVAGDTIIVGASQSWVSRPGAAYVFERVGGVWTQTAKLTGSGETEGFGLSLAMSGSTVLIGAHADEWNGFYTGAAYTFERAGGAWTQTARITADDGYRGDEFGYAVAISGDTVLIGAHQDGEKGVRRGSAYVFHRSDGSWTQTAKFRAGDTAENDRFGYSIALAGEDAFIGAPYADPIGEDSGATYVYSLGPCPTDFNGDGVMDTRDMIAFLNAWASGDPRADWDQSGTIDTQDVLAFLNDWAAGC